MSPTCLTSRRATLYIGALKETKVQQGFLSSKSIFESGAEQAILFCDRDA